MRMPDRVRSRSPQPQSIRIVIGFACTRHKQKICYKFPLGNYSKWISDIYMFSKTTQRFHSTETTIPVRWHSQYWPRLYTRCHHDLPTVRTIQTRGSKMKQRIVLDNKAKVKSIECNIIYFRGHYMPERVRLFHTQIFVHYYKPRPLTSISCCRYGHVKKYCRINRSLSDVDKITMLGNVSPEDFLCDLWKRTSCRQPRL
jgi:hypothetical protein